MRQIRIRFGMNFKPEIRIKWIQQTKSESDIHLFYFIFQEQQSPRLERARGGKPVSDITKLYTANLSKPEVTTPELASPNRPRRNDNITKLYTNGFDAAKNNFKGKPNDEYTNPKKVIINYSFHITINTILYHICSDLICSKILMVRNSCVWGRISNH